MSIADESQARRVASRFRPAVLHPLGSAGVAGFGTYLLVGLWYPYPYNRLAGGLELLAIMLSVDIVLGPVLTFVVAAPGKLLRALARQMRVVSAADIDPDTLAEAPVPALRSLPWFGPRTFAAVKPTDPGELFIAMQLGVSGIDLAMVPRYWRAYESQRDALLAKSRPVATLTQRYPDLTHEIEALATSAGTTVAELRFLPLRSQRATDWVTVVAAPDARIVGHLHRDGFL